MDPLAAVLAVGAAHHGVASVEAAHALGLSPGALRHQCDTGRLRRVGRRVLVLPGTPTGPRHRVMLGIVDASPGAFACSTHGGSPLGSAGLRCPPRPCRPI